MGYTSNDKLVNALVSYFKLDPVDFPHGGPSNLFYLRGQRFTVGQANDPTFTPPYDLPADDKGVDPRSWSEHDREGVPRLLDVDAAAVEEGDVPGIQRPRLQRSRLLELPRAEHDERGVRVGRDATGHTFEVANWNCAQALPWYMLDGNASYFTLAGGYDQLPLVLASAFAQAGGTTFMSTPVTSVESEITGPQGATTFALTAADGSSCTATAVVLAMPRRALSSELLHPRRGLRPGAVTSVTGQPVLKIFCCYDTNWWFRSGSPRARARRTFRSGRRGTSVPTARRTRSRCSWPATATRSLRPTGRGSRRARASRPRVHRPPIPTGPSRRRAPTSSRRSSGCSPSSTGCRSPTRTALPGWTGRGIPTAARSTRGTWAFGPIRSRSNLQPDPSQGLYVCGEAYSFDQGWVEGALDTAEQVVTMLGADAWTP